SPSLSGAPSSPASTGKSSRTDVAGQPRSRVWVLGCAAAVCLRSASVPRRMAGTFAGGRVEDRLIRLTGLDGLRHRVVDVEDRVLGAVGAVSLEVLLLHDRERLHDVGDVITLDPVQVEEGSVQFATD